MLMELIQICCLQPLFPALIVGLCRYSSIIHMPPN